MLLSQAAVHLGAAFWEVAACGLKGQEQRIADFVALLASGGADSVGSVAELAAPLLAVFPASAPAFDCLRPLMRCDPRAEALKSIRAVSDAGADCSFDFVAEWAQGTGELVQQL